MSNLILPNQPVMPFLEENLKAFFTRYPHEKNRLEPILRKPAAPRQLPLIEMPVAPSKPPMRILLLLGLANPVFIATLLNDETVRRECFKLFIFENDPEFAAFCFQHSNLTQIINFTKSEWFICHSEETVKPALFRALKPEAVTSMMLNVQTLEPHTPKSDEVAAFYEKMGDIYQETARHVFHNHGRLDDSLLGLEVTIRNKEWLLNAPGIQDLENHYDGCSALLIGAGPSLDHNLATIKKYNDRFVVIAADAALKPLLNAGIRVDYVTSIERLNDYQKPFFEGLEKTDAELVAFPVLHPEVLALYPGRVRLVYRNYSFYAYFEKAWPKGILKSGGSTAHLGLRLAAYFGCRRIFMVGLDSAYEEKDGLYRSHCSGTGHPEWGNFIPLEDFQAKRRHLFPLKAENNLGQQVTTNMTYYQWIKEYSEELVDLGHKLSIKNCSATGLKIPGVPFAPLDQAAESLDPMVVEKPEATHVEMTRGWDNRDLVKNFSGWLQMSLDAIAECDALMSMEEPDQNRFNAIMYLSNFRFSIDDLFVSFVIQIAAAKFFEQENRFWSFRMSYDFDKKEKLAVLKDRFQLFETTLKSLIAMFNIGEEQKDGSIKVHQQGNH